MANLYEWQERIRDVEREHSATRLATDRLREAVDHDPSILPPDLPPRVIRLASVRLDGTYVIRLFAEFEAGLRLFWPTARGTGPPGRTRDLLDGVAATCSIPFNQTTNAHAVREYRNDLIHQRGDAVDPIPIALARRHLCRFFSFLPPTW